ncbi:dethiobiotin synthase [Candidatus Magnetobacterium casense]|uniref:ATP-dependent dethiobiotin synthetase BioD n=1 Tax=Candidatus Magnetobacterium casense TaxID=1455061 RepID=A0ABS6RV07_9BACT|nr:dethiobiotin synthase [Candidatus Magnetobacterium casensis]MBV6340469.1 dethiobiotin synthase [Candidatus Magnetobacterium casensis]
MRGFFVTATDTGVGKTIVTALVALALQQRGLRVAAMKPIETGCTLENGRLVPGDGMFLKTTLNLDLDIDRITPVRYTLPLAPMVAAAISGKAVDLDLIRRRFQELSTFDAVVVEGIGGLMVPITQDYFVCDMIKELALPAILVTSAGLGSINHTMLSVELLRSRGIETAGVIINHNVCPDGKVANTTNPDVIKQLSPLDVIATVPFIEKIDRTTLETLTGVLCLD